MKSLALLALLPVPALAQIDVSDDDLIFPGPYRAEVARVIDGDTVEMQVAIWPGLAARYAIRVRGIDAPETHRTACEAEARGGARATEIVAEHIPPGTRVRLTDVSYGTFANRVVADVARVEDGRDLATLLIGAGHAVAWEPGQDDVPWCLLLEEQ